MVLVAKVFNGAYLLRSQIVALEFLCPLLLVLHPEDPLTIKIKRHKYLRDFKFSVGPDFVDGNVNFVEVILFDVQVCG